MPKIIWKSEIFPGFLFTQEMLDVFKKAFSHVPSFQVELIKMEAWFVAHADRVPSDWSGRIYTWMKDAERFATEDKTKKFSPRNQTRPRNPRLDKAEQQYKFERPPDRNDDHVLDGVNPLGEILGNIKQHNQKPG